MPRTNDELWELLNGQIACRLETLNDGQVETNRHLTELNGTVAANAERSRKNELAFEGLLREQSKHDTAIEVLKTEAKYQKEGSTVATADRSDLRKDLVKLAVQVAATGGGTAAAIAIAKGLGWL